MRILFILTVFLFVVVISASAQSAATCPEIVDQALTSLDQTCNTLDRNTACYGSSYVAATFTDPVSSPVFAHPADRVELTRLKSIQTSPMDEASGVWGLAMLNVQANVPNSLPGQGVIFILMGDARLENQLDDTANLPDLRQLTTITTSVPANLRSQPDKKANVIRSVPAETTLQVDVLSPDKKWARVITDGVPAWIHWKGINDFDTLQNLPHPELTAMSPMQVFQFTGGIGANSCQQSQGSLLVQGPNQVKVDIEVNGAHIRIGSTILINKTAANELQVTVLSGEVNVDGVSVPAGYFTKAPLGADNQVQDNFTPATLISMEEYQNLQMFNALPTDVVHYIPNVPDPQTQSHQINIPVNPDGGGHENQGNHGNNPHDKKDKDKKEKENNGHGHHEDDHHDHRDTDIHD
ncbi:MAG TPA: SH3 domain-containing protein [Phototrophicaceae bacterium]|jgi:hypothetical protein|nr:SH3 domain-containing protein [Phototrophicaceae bacterium]